MKSRKIIPASIVLLSLALFACDEEYKAPTYEYVPLPCGCDEICTPEDVSSNKLEINPKYPFYLKVGETKKVKCPLSGTTNVTVGEQRYFYWENNNPENIDLKPIEASGATPNNYNANVTGLKATGIKEAATVTATNRYTPALQASFTMHVIDFVPSSMYLWEYNSDLKQFRGGASSGAGVTNGTATLNGESWAFTRSAALSLGGANGGIQFGKNDNPENVTLTKENDRKVKSIVVECGSNRAQGKMTISVGDTKICNEVTMKDAYYNTLTYYEYNCNELIGDIKLEFKTPEFDEEKSMEEDYIHPGATYLKSIWVTYC